MADDNKAVGPLAAAKLIALIKAETAKKYDKTGGKIGGSAEITGDVHAGGTVQSDLLLSAPSVTVHNDAAGASVHISCSGDNAARISSLDSGGKSHYSRFAVGTPTGDNDAATKAYVDGLVTGHEVITVTSTEVSDLGYDAAEGATKYSVTFDASFDSILANLAANKPMKFNIALPDGTGSMPISFNTGYFSALNNGMFAFTGSIAGAPIVLSIGGLGSAIVYLYADYLPAPNPDGSDDGKSLAVDGDKWTIKKTAIDDVLSDTSTNPVQNKVVKAALDKKAGKDIATAEADGLMSAADKAKLDSMDSVCYDIYAKIGTADTHDSVYKYGCTVSHTFAEIDAAVHAGKTPRVLLVDDINNPSDTRIICPLLEYDMSRSEGGYYFDAPGLVGVNGSGRIYIDENGAMYTCSAGELPAVGANQDGKYLMIDGGRWTYRRPDTATATAPGFMPAADKAKLDRIEDGANKTIVDAELDAASANPVQNKAVKVALDGKAGTAVATTSANGLMSKDDKEKLNGVEAGANKTVVDAALDAASENPVQNKAVKAALDGKLSTLGGEISGHLDVGQTVSAEGSVSVGRTSTDTGIHFEKAASDAGRISHGSDPMTGVSPIARLKVASPTEDDDAATKKYVDDRAVRYDAAQTLDGAQQGQARTNIGAIGHDSPQFAGYLSLAPANAPLGTGVGLSPTRDGNNYALDISDVNEGNPTLLTGVKTPTDADTNAAATVEYVKNKVSEVAASGGVNVDNALSATSTNPVQNKVITSALAKKAGTAVATESTNGLMSKADKTKLDGIAAGATKITIDSAMSGSSNNPVANHVVKQYVDDKVAAAGSNITVDSTLSSTSTNPVQNKAVKAAIDGKLSTSGGTLTGNLIGKYITGTWLQSTAASDLGRTPGKIAVLDDSGWVYYRTPSELFADLGIANAIKSYVDAAIIAAINSAY